MKIVALSAENVKRLVAVEIRPDGNLVQITGRNGQGKTSILDSIWWALAGASHIQAAPIRKGANSARIRLDLGEIVVTRTFSRMDDGQVTTSIKVETAEGARFPSPQKMLDSLLGELSFDPLQFCRMKPREQFDTLRRFVPGVDFDAIEAANKADYDRRTEANRRAKEAKAAAAQVQVPEDAPAEPVDEAALVGELERAGQHNADIERRRAARETASEKVSENRQRVAGITARMDERATSIARRRDERVAGIEAEIERLRTEIQAVLKQADDDIAGIRDAASAEARALTKEADELEAKLAAAGPLPEPIDTAAVRAHLDAARQANEAVAARRRREALLAQATEAEGKAAGFTASITSREAEKQAAVAAAEMPVPGLAFGDGAVLLNGVPFEQASDAEQLRASIGIAMASNPKLRVIRVRDGSLLDEDGMRLLAEMADAHDCQVWVEAVRSDGKVGFVIEDGMVKQGAEAPAVEGMLL